MREVQFLGNTYRNIQTLFLFRNGREKVDLDLIVLDTLPDCECSMFRTANKMCSCTHSYTGYEIVCFRLG
jgi:hypothetical protein